MTVVIAGAGLAGARTAETLRADGYDERIVLVGDEPKAPYERPALSKQFLAGARNARDIELRPHTYWVENEIDLLTGTRVESVDFDRRVAIVGGAAVRWDAFVLATGARPRRLPGPPGVHHLRTLGDAEALAPALEVGAEVVIVGAGFVGAEVASTARSLGAEVTLVDAAPLPFAHIFGEDVGRLLADRYVSHGVRLRLGVGVHGFRTGADGRLAAVQLSNGTGVEARVAVVGIGVEPATELLTPGTVETDASGRTHRPGVYACGDVAAWWRPSLGAHRRVAHWTSAAGQARAVARSILGLPESYDEPPYFWSDQFGLRLQYVGHAKDWTIVELDGDEGSFVARYLRHDGADAAALAVNRPHEVAALRRALAA